MAGKSRRGFYKNALRVSDLESMYEQAVAVHLEFERICTDDPHKVTCEDLSEEATAYRLALTAYNACELSKLQATNSLLRGHTEAITAYVACKRYVDDVGSSVLLLQAV